MSTHTQHSDDGSDDVLVNVRDVEVGDYAYVRAAGYDWERPLEVTGIEQVVLDDETVADEVSLAGDLGAEFYFRLGIGDRPTVHGRAGYSVGGLVEFTPTDDPDDTRRRADRDLTPREAWREVCERASVSSHADFEETVDAIASAGSLFEATRSARLPRPQVGSIISALGLSGRGSFERDFPPQNLDERVEMVRNGELPEDARARYWEDDDDE